LTHSILGREPLLCSAKLTPLPFPPHLPCYIIAIGQLEGTSGDLIVPGEGSRVTSLDGKRIRPKVPKRDGKRKTSSRERNKDEPPPPSALPGTPSATNRGVLFGIPGGKHVVVAVLIAQN